MSDLALRYGNLHKGLIRSAMAIVEFIILPIIIIIFTSALLESDGGHSTLNLDQTLLGLRTVFIVLGGLLGVISFFCGFYQRGSVSRLLFGEVRSIVVIGLGYFLLIGSGMHDAMMQAGPDIDLTSIFYLFTVMIGIGMLYILGEWVDSRWTWQKAKAEIDGVPYQPISRHPPEDPKGHRPLHDFRFRYGRLTKGIAMARSALLRYIILPVAVLIVLKAVISSLSATLASDLSGTLSTTMTLLFFVGIPIAILSFFKGFYPKGSYSRMSFSIGIVAMIDLWMWYATLQGRFQASFDNVKVDINYQPYVLLVIIGVSLWAIYYVVELISYRKDWIAQNYEPVDEQKAAERQLRDKELRRAKKDKERSD